MVVCVCQMQFEGMEVRTFTVCRACLRKDQGSALLIPGVSGPLPQGTRTPELIFLLVEGQQGARIEKCSTSAPYLGQEGPLDAVFNPCVRPSPHVETGNVFRGLCARGGLEWGGGGNWLSWACRTIRNPGLTVPCILWIRGSRQWRTSSIKNKVITFLIGASNLRKVSPIR